MSLAVNLWTPSASATVVKLQAPLPFTGVLPIKVAPSYTCMLVLATAVPVNVNTFPLVMPSPPTLLSGKNEAMIGTGGPLPIVTFNAAEGVLVLPAQSLSVAVNLWMPPLKVPVCKLHVPLAATYAVPSIVVPS